MTYNIWDGVVGVGGEEERNGIQLIITTHFLDCMFILYLLHTKKVPFASFLPLVWQ